MCWFEIRETGDGGGGMSNTGRLTNLAGKTENERRGQVVDKKCKECGEGYEGDKRSKYCSSKCKERSKKREYRGRGKVEEVLGSGVKGVDRSRGQDGSGGQERRPVVGLRYGGYDSLEEQPFEPERGIYKVDVWGREFVPGRCYKRDEEGRVVGVQGR